MEDDRSNQDEVVGFGPFHLHPLQRALRRGGEEMSLGGRAFDILVLLLERAGEVVSKQEIVDRAWAGVHVDDGSLRVHIANLRKSLGDGRDGARYIKNVPGRGYSFVGAVERAIATPASTTTGKVADTEPTAKGIPALPPKLTRMVGRDSVVTELAHKLKADRFVTLVGPGGVGKTTVSISVAHEVRGSFSAVAFVDLGGVTRGDMVETAVAVAVGLVPHAESMLPGLLAHVRTRSILILLDNCEHVIDAASRLAQRIYEEAPKAFILATSREALRVDGESVYRLAPLEYPPSDTSLSADEIRSWPSVQIFMERAAAGGYRLEHNDQNTSIVASVCRRLDGIAFAIELAAGRAATYGVAGIAELLDTRLNLHWQGRRGALPRQQTMFAMLDWSDRLLPEEDSIVLRRLSIFIGAFTADAASRVVSDHRVPPMQVHASLVSLVEKSLITITSGPVGQAYRLLEITRSYAAVKLEESGEHSAIARRHALYVSEALATGEGEAAFADHAALFGNLRCALEWSFSNSVEDIAVPLAALAVPVFRRNGRLGECVQCCERAVAILGPPFSGTIIELTLLEGYAISTMFTRGNRPYVSGIILRALEIARSLHSEEDELRQLSWLHIFETRAGRFEAAMKVAERAGVIAGQIDQDKAKSVADWMLGASYHVAGDQRKAQAHCEAALRRATRATDAAYLASYGIGQRVRGLAIYARTLWLRGFPERADAILRQAIQEAEERQHPLALCLSFMYAATISIWRRDLAAADERIERLIACSDANSLVPFSAVGLGLRGEVAVIRGQIEEGIADIRSALARLEEERYLVLSTEFMRALAEALGSVGRIEEGIALLERAFAQAASSGESYQLPELLRARGLIQSNGRSANLTFAEKDFAEAISLARKQSAPGYELRAAIPLAELWLKSGRENDARQLLDRIIVEFADGASDPDIQRAKALVLRQPV